MWSNFVWVKKEPSLSDVGDCSQRKRSCVIYNENENKTQAVRKNKVEAVPMNGNMRTKATNRFRAHQASHRDKTILVCYSASEVRKRDELTNSHEESKSNKNPSPSKHGTKVCTTTTNTCNVHLRTLGVYSHGSSNEANWLVQLSPIYQPHEHHL
jgi:hypothetical protein